VTAPQQRRAAPWEPGDLVRLVVLTLVALAVIGVAWYGASGEGRLSHQMSWLNLSVAGLMVTGAGNLMWLARGRRSVGERRRELLARWEPAGPAGSSWPTSAPEREVPADGPLVRAAGMRLAHRPGCPLVAGKHTAPALDGGPRCRICGEDRP
jgi:hypothetical protein